LKLEKSRTIHYYGSYFINEIRNLSKFAEFLCKKRFAPIIYLSNNKVIRNLDDKIVYEDINYSKQPHKAFAEIDFPENLSEYEEIYIYLSASYRVNEEHLLSTGYINSFEYIRCYLGKIIAEDDKYSYQIYTSVKIYNTGVILLELSVFSPEEEIIDSLKTFIDNDVNLFANEFKRLKFPVYIASKAFIEKSCMFKKYSDYIRKNIENYFEDDNNFFVIDIDPLYPDEYFNINFIKDYLFDYLELEINSFSRKYPNKMGNYWIGKPIVFIEKYNLNDVEKKGLISSTIARAFLKQNQYDDYAEVNLRKFGDYEYYVTEAVSLILNKKQYVEDFENTIPSILVIHQEIFHLYLLYKQELEIVDLTESFEDILDHKKFVTYLKELFIEKNSNFGEINDVINHSLYKKLKLNDLEVLLDKKIENKSIEVQYFNEKRNSIFIEIITIFFGVIGSSPIFEYITKPLFDVSSTMSESKQIAYFLATLSIIILIIFILRFLIGFTKSSR